MMIRFILSMLFVLGCSCPASATETTYQILGQTQDVVWGFDFLPDGRWILNLRSGKMQVFDPKTKNFTGVSGVPAVVAKGQGGLLDVRLHPQFSKNQMVYFTFSESKASGQTTVLGRAKLKDYQLVDLERLFSALPANDNDIHYGSRIEFDDKGYLFISVGDRNDRHLAQDLSTHLGKILRLKDDGSVPKDNPFYGQIKHQPEIFSYGHRNPQGLYFDRSTKRLWGTEFGPRGGDELNLIEAGKNYGWPVVTYGREYWGPKIGEGTTKDGMVSPIAHWVPSISPSGLAGRGSELFIANLSSTHLRQLSLTPDGKVRSETKLLEGLGRFRNVRFAPDGSLCFSMDDGRIGRLIVKAQ